MKKDKLVKVELNLEDAQFVYEALLNLGKKETDYPLNISILELANKFKDIRFTKK